VIKKIKKQPKNRVLGPEDFTKKNERLPNTTKHKGKTLKLRRMG